jgi:hypothetical protein
MKNEILLTDVLDYAKQNSVSKNELLYLLQMYNSYKKDKTGGAELTTEDLIRNIAIINEDLKHGSDTRLVVSRVTEELNILNELAYLTKSQDEAKKYDLGYRICQLMFDCDIKFEKSNKVLEKKIRSKGGK